MEEFKVEFGKVYKHFKGGCSLVLFTAKHSDRDETLVVYKGLNNKKIYARPIESFCQNVIDENGNSVPRFSLAKEEDYKDLLEESDKNLVENSEK